MSSTGCTYPILCNQENFLLQGNGYQIKKCLPDSHVIIKEAVKSPHDSGRPKNGMFIAVPGQLKEFVTDVSPSNWRVQAVILHTNGSNIMIVNTYFPTDPKVNDFDSTELQSTLSSIQDLITKNDYNSIVWTGDINADFRRCTKFTRYIESFVVENNFSSGWDKFPIDFTHVQENNGKSFSSILDHFFWSESIEDVVINAGVLHLVNNFSDHCPVYCQIEISEMAQENATSIKQSPKPSWSKASEDERVRFTNTLEEHLIEITIDNCLLSCNNVHCKDESHKKACDNLIIDVLETVDKLSIEHLTPKISQRKKKKHSIAFWHDEIEPFKQDAQFWHSVWISAGRPLNTELHKVMKRTRNIYHLQIRKCKKAADTLQRNALLNACINGNGDIYKEIRKMRKTNTTLVNTIDGITEDIPEHFASIYSRLYNSVDEKSKLESLYGEIVGGINSSEMSEIQKITTDVAKEVIGHLKKIKLILCSAPLQTVYQTLHRSSLNT